MAARMRFESQFAGPLPPPGMLAEYERAHPGLVERIVRMAEAEAAHRHEMDRRDLDGAHVAFRRNQHLQALGTVCGLAVGVAGLVAAAYCAHVHEPVAATVIGGASLGSLVGSFIYGVHRRTAAQVPAEAAPRESGPLPPPAPATATQPSLRNAKKKRR